MADFHQTGCVTTLHRLETGGVHRLEAELRRFSRSRPVGLILPALYSEFETPAMGRIADELAEVDYVGEIVLPLARADRNQLEKARAVFSGFRSPVTIIWIDSPRIENLFRLLADYGIDAGPDGKGRSCWLSCGYLLARGECEVIALHDCDIVNYDRGFVARLCYPLMNPNLNFDFCKAYYARLGGRMHGRVTRLFMTPLIRALAGIFPMAMLLRFLDSFRYPLAGEFAMRSNLARQNRIPSGWGLEIGMLAEAFRNCPACRICQVDLADNYEHKHQALSPEDPAAGLHRMSYEIAKTLFRTLAAEGVVLADEHFRTLAVRYCRLAEDAAACYYADALLNGLRFDRDEEERAIATFAQSICRAGQDFAASPLGLPSIPSWDRVVSAIPDFFGLLLRAIECDEVEATPQAA